ncbi:recombinase family protein [Butyricicoccus porcorum]|uniref:Resolvase/invertase-type recombinase catalytic domain-containing protein n=1 Tax=Butyricicoccus porcorum TaxID=1945634 RepID=A0A252F194_9FIRM|nr:recombinase family protein [Butyricicoccus porcorum]OUM19595.1 hypothetical protein CBW42_12355 [Butyricicoccus porcorum]
MSKEVGYVRVSSAGQNLERQIEALRKYVPDEMIVTDKVSGKDFNRPGYQSLKVGIGKLVEGDTLYIKSLDRLGRNKSETIEELRYFKNIGVQVKVLDIPTTMIDRVEGQEWVFDMINNLLIEVLASVAEQERKTTKQRQAEGVACMPVDENGKKYSAKTGRYRGRPALTAPKNWNEVYAAWKAGEITAKEAMEKTETKRTSFYKLVKLTEEEQNKN